MKLEKDAELYDSTRDPYSNASSIKLLVPIFKHGDDLAISAIAGVDVELNGPQVNDKHFTGHAGVEIEKKYLTDIGRFTLQASVEAVKYLYEVDDEPAGEQTGTASEQLDHSGTGSLLTTKFQYNVESEKIRVVYSILSAGDDRQKQGDYSRNKFIVSWDHIISKSTECGIEYSITTHKYKPTALVHKDELYATQAGCKYKF